MLISSFPEAFCFTTVVRLFLLRPCELWQGGDSFVDVVVAVARRKRRRGVYAVLFIMKTFSTRHMALG
jgi:hypothetical protein